MTNSLKFDILLTEPQSAAENMQTDATLLNSLHSNPRIILHFYSWIHPSATYGYFLNPVHFFNPIILEKRTLDIARRPTGGGVIFHHCDLAYSVIIPSQHPKFSLNTLDNYAFINLAIVDAVNSFLGGKAILNLLQLEVESKTKFTSHFCMAKPTKYDVMIQGRKIGGGAQRKTRYGFLHQGTLCLSLPTKDFLQEVLISYNDTFEEMKSYSYPLETMSPWSSFETTKKEMQVYLIRSIKQHLDT